MTILLRTLASQTHTCVCIVWYTEAATEIPKISGNYALAQTVDTRPLFLGGGGGGGGGGGDGVAWERG